MYIIVIAWLYVVVLMAATEKNVVSGILTFLFYGLIPCAILLWILGVNHRKFKKIQAQNQADSIELDLTQDLTQSLSKDELSQPNAADTKANQ